MIGPVSIRTLDQTLPNTPTPNTNQTNIKEPESNQPDTNYTENQEVEKKWLVIVYAAGDNDLSSYLFEDIDELETVGSDKNTHIISILDQGKYGTQFKGARIFYLQKDKQLGKINSPVIQNLSQINLADPKTMGKLIGELMSKYPSTHVAVILSDHGSGWQGAIEDDFPKKSFMTLQQIKEALSTALEIAGRKIDVLGWDACLMAMAEVGYELKDFAKYMVASEQLEGADGWPYSRIFASTLKHIISTLQKEIQTNIEHQPKDLAETIVKEAQNFSHSIKTLSAVDLEKAQLVATKLDELAKEIINDPSSFSQIIRAMRRTERFYQNFRDLGHFAQLIQTLNVNPNIKTKAQELEQALKEYVIKEFHTDDHPNATGVSIEMPVNSKPTSDYLKTSLAQNTSWDEMLTAMFTAPRT
ncbi:MAG: clostripain-related cysteine peptidase [bacterium]